MGRWLDIMRLSRTDPLTSTISEQVPVPALHLSSAGFVGKICQTIGMVSEIGRQATYSMILSGAGILRPYIMGKNS